MALVTTVSECLTVTSAGCPSAPCAAGLGKVSDWPKSTQGICGGAWNRPLVSRPNAALISTRLPPSQQVLKSEGAVAEHTSPWAMLRQHDEACSTEQLDRQAEWMDGQIQPGLSNTFTGEYPPLTTGIVLWAQPWHNTPGATRHQHPRRSVCWG